MNKVQRSTLRRFRRVQEFLTTNKVAGTAVKLAVLADVQKQMSDNGEEQDATLRLARAETARQRALRATLWDQNMAPISRIARRAFGVPGMDVKFALPRKRADNEAVLNAARGMAQAAAQHVSVFVQQEGLPADFLTQLHSAIDALAGALVVRVESVRRRKTANETMAKLVQRGRATVDVLDAIVTPRLLDKPDLLAAWKSVKRPVDLAGAPSAPVGDAESVAGSAATTTPAAKAA